MSKDQAGGRYSKKVARVEAEVYYDLGCKAYRSYLEQSKKNNSSLIVYILEPGMVNISFACEIAMKVFYEMENRKMLSGHKLYSQLYLALPGELQNTISERTIKYMENRGHCGYTSRSFVDNLAACDNIFQEARYSFEYIPGTIGEHLEPDFLLCFATTLIEILRIAGDTYSF